MFLVPSFLRVTFITKVKKKIDCQSESTVKPKKYFLITPNSTIYVTFWYISFSY